MGTNDWNHYACHVTEDDILETARFVANSSLAAAGYSYINVDDCWASTTRDEHGQLQADPLTFPHGMEWLVEQIHGLGLKFGIYSCASQPTCARRQGSLYHETSDAALFASWKVDYLKYDKCGEGSLGIAAYAAMRDALNRTGRPIFYDAASIDPILADAEMPYLGNSVGTWSDIKSEWGHLMRNIDNNDRWAALAKPGYFNDPGTLCRRLCRAPAGC